MFLYLMVESLIELRQCQSDATIGTCNYDVSHTFALFISVCGKSNGNPLPVATLGTFFLRQRIQAPLKNSGQALIISFCVSGKSGT